MDKKKNYSNAYLHDLGAIQTVSHALPHNFCRVNNILQNGFMHCSECTVARTNDSWTLLWGPQNPSSGNEYHILQITEVMQYEKKFNNYKKNNVEIYLFKKSQLKLNCSWLDLQSLWLDLLYYTVMSKLNDNRNQDYYYFFF